jgi:hypothetical protein
VMGCAGVSSGRATTTNNMTDILPFHPADRRRDPTAPEQGDFVAIFAELSRQWATCRQRHTSRAGVVADVIDIRTRRALSNLDAVLVKLGRPMSELEVVLARFGAAIAERERQQHAAREKPE